MAGQIGRWEDRRRAGLLCSIASADDITTQTKDSLYDFFKMVKADSLASLTTQGMSNQLTLFTSLYFATLAPQPLCCPWPPASSLACLSCTHIYTSFLRLYHFTTRFALSTVGTASQST